LPEDVQCSVPHISNPGNAVCLHIPALWWLSFPSDEGGFPGNGHPTTPDISDLDNLTNYGYNINYDFVHKYSELFLAETSSFFEYFSTNRFPWCSGYHIRLTRGRSPVRPRAETLVFEA
ncbi:hypothetical protein WA026_020002, partial [Henosepilachna vigintioctopunctata]